MTHLFSLIALLVLSVSVSSAFVESAYAEGEDPIQIVLDITYENIQESLEGVDDPEAVTLFLAGEEKYLEALAALEAGDIASAKESAIIAMALFESSAEEIGALEDQASTQFPSGLGTAAANIFSVQEGITSSVNEVAELRKIIQSNDLDIDLDEFDEYVNLAKTLLAEGVVPDAQAQLDLVNQIKTELYAEIQGAANDISVSGIKDVLDDKENLGLTKEEIKELEEMAEDLSTEDSNAPGNSGDAPGQNKNKGGDDASGKNADAPGQNKNNGGDDASVKNADAPGQNKNKGGDDASVKNADAPGQNKNKGGDDASGKNADAPGQNKNKGGDDASGVGNIPPGQLNKLGYSSGYEQSPDDYYENHYESQIDDTYEETFDGTNRGHGDGKGKYGSHPGKDNADAPKSEAVGNTKGGNPNCNDEGITDGDSDNTDGVVGEDYIIQGFTAVGSSCNDVTSNNIIITVNGPSSPPSFDSLTGDEQPFTFQPDEPGTWTLVISAEGQFGSRTITVAGADAGADFSLTQLTTGQLNGTASIANAITGAIVSYSWDEPFPLDANNIAEPTFTAPARQTGQGAINDYVFTLTVTYENIVKVDTVEVHITPN